MYNPSFFLSLSFTYTHKLSASLCFYFPGSPQSTHTHTHSSQLPRWLMRICDSAGGKWDREKVESKDTRICHWGNEGLQGSTLTSSSCLANGWWEFRIDLPTERTRLERLLWMWPLSFFPYPFIFIQLAFLPISLFLNMGSPLFLAISLARALSSQCLLSLPPFWYSFTISSPSLTLCLSLYHHCLCPSSLIILSPRPSVYFLCSSPPFRFIHILIFLCLSIHLSVSFFSGGRAD